PCLRRGAAKPARPSFFFTTTTTTTACTSVWMFLDQSRWAASAATIRRAAPGRRGSCSMGSRVALATERCLVARPDLEFVRQAATGPGKWLAMSTGRKLFVEELDVAGKRV